MQAGFTIAEVARRSGFRPSTLRYYEEIGLVTPIERTHAGYRVYDDRAVERLAFIGRAKQLGCSLDEIADLLTAWDTGSCAPVQHRLRALLDAKIEQAGAQIAELLAFTSQLRTVREGLDRHTPDGPCDVSCGCTTGPGDTAEVALTRGPTRPEPIACTLDATQVPDRVAEWQSLLGAAGERTAIAGGVRVAFAADVDVAELARLTAAEQECCRFLAFTITMDGRGTALEVRAPDDARPVVESLFGAPA
jgi:DNA-binding transcriptional MerR regulator